METKLALESLYVIRGFVNGKDSGGICWNSSQYFYLNQKEAEADAEIFNKRKDNACQII